MLLLPCFYVFSCSMLSTVRPFLNSTSGALFGGSKKSSSTSAGDRINITIRKWDETGKRSQDTPFTIKPDSSFRGIFRIYAVRESLFPDCLGYFKFMAGDRMVSEDESPMDAHISDGDCIDAVPCVDDLVGSRFV